MYKAHKRYSDFTYKAQKSSGDLIKALKSSHNLMYNTRELKWLSSLSFDSPTYFRLPVA